MCILLLIVSAFAYILSILLGNIFVEEFGIGTLSLTSARDPSVSYFSLAFPLGALWIGLTFSFRDFMQQFWGHLRAWLWMFVATWITYLMCGQTLAIASVSSFLAAECIDWGIFYLLRSKSMRVRLMVSNIFSCPVDSLIFVTLAFGVPWYSEAVWGQAVVKYACGFLALPLIGLFEKLVNFFLRRKPV